MDALNEFYADIFEKSQTDITDRSHQFKAISTMVKSIASTFYYNYQIPVYELGWLKTVRAPHSVFKDPAPQLSEHELTRCKDDARRNLELYLKAREKGVQDRSHKEELHLQYYLLKLDDKFEKARNVTDFGLDRNYDKLLNEDASLFVSNHETWIAVHCDIVFFHFLVSKRKLTRFSGNGRWPIPMSCT